MKTDRRSFLKGLAGLVVAPAVVPAVKAPMKIGVDWARAGEEVLDSMCYVVLATGPDGRAKLYSYRASADGNSLTVGKWLDGKGVACG